MRRGVRTERPDQGTLGHLLERQCRHNLVDGGLLVLNHATIDLTDGTDQGALVARRIVRAGELFELRVQLGKARREAEPQPVQDREIGLVDAVHGAGDRGRSDVRRIAIPDVAHMMPLEVMRADEPTLQADEPTLQGDMIAQQGVGDDALAATEGRARRARLDGRSLHPKLLPVDAAVERVKREGLVRENGQGRNAVADPVVGGLQRRVAQVLLVGRLQDVVGNSTGLGHDVVAVVHRLGDDDRDQTLRGGDLLGVARRERREGGQERALVVDKADDVGDIAGRKLCVKALLLRERAVSFGSAPRERFGLTIVVEMRELSLA